MSKNLITETMVLPSATVKLYGDNFDGQLTLRAMTTVEERARLSGESFYGTMSYIINECIVDNKNNDGSYKIDSAAFTDFDFFAVCVKLRMLSYGNFYKTVAVCPKCGHQFVYKADLSQLNYNLVPEDFTEPYEIGPLPHSGDTLGCRFLRVKDRLDIEKKKNMILAQNPTYQGDPKYTLEMQRRIVEVNGKKLDPIQAEEYVDNMIAGDATVYHDTIDRYDFGVVLFNLTECQNPKGCNSMAYWRLTNDKQFFRPGID